MRTKQTLSCEENDDVIKTNREEESNNHSTERSSRITSNDSNVRADNILELLGAIEKYQGPQSAAEDADDTDDADSTLTTPTTLTR